MSKMSKKCPKTKTKLRAGRLKKKCREFKLVLILCRSQHPTNSNQPYSGFGFELNFELNHILAWFNEKMNFQNGSPRATLGSLVPLAMFYTNSMRTTEDSSILKLRFCLWHIIFAILSWMRWKASKLMLFTFHFQNPIATVAKGRAVTLLEFIQFRNETAWSAKRNNVEYFKPE